MNQIETQSLNIEYEFTLSHVLILLFIFLMMISTACIETGTGTGPEEEEPEEEIIEDISELFQMDLKEGQVYRVEVELECNLRVDIISFSLVDCNAESSDRGVFVNELAVRYN